MIKKEKDAFTLAESAAHGIIADDYRLNLTCHCEDSERNEEDEAISLNKFDSMPRDCHATPTAPLAMTWNEKRKAAFTLAESAAHAKWLPKARHAEHTCHAEANAEASPKHGRKATFWGCFAALNMTPAFTLAETLITLLVIGVVAALTIPSLMQQIGDYTLQKQKDVFSKKWQEGLRQMRVDGKLETSYTTAEFVNEMGKYFKIASVCDSNNLTDCFAEKITSYENGEAEEFDVKDLKSAKNFNKSEQDSPVYGIRFSDGTNMLLAYKKDCKGISEGDTRGNHTACLLYVYDVNANKSPNSYGGNTGFDAKDGENKMSDEKKASINKGRDLVGNVSITKGNPFGLDFEIIGAAFQSASLDSCSGSDYWQCAIDHCESLHGSMPTKEQLEQIAEKVYENCTVTAVVEDGYKKYDCSSANLSDNPLWQIITNESSSGNGNFIWSNTSSRAGRADGRGFFTNESRYYDRNRTYYNMGALCIK